MKFPLIKIEWTEPAKMPITIEVKHIENGYLLGNTFFATETELVKALAELVKNPDAYYTPPVYKD